MDEKPFGLKLHEEMSKRGAAAMAAAVLVGYRIRLKRMEAGRI